MDHARTSNGFGLNPISFTEIDAWQRLSGEMLRPWELRAIRRMDLVVIEHANSKAAEETKGTAQDVVSNRPMSGSLFDALFGG